MRAACALLMVAAATTPVLVACSTDTTQPAHAVVADAVNSTVILGTTASPLRQALAEEYRSALDEQGRDVDVVTVPAQERIDRLRSGELTMVVGCVGELLDTLDAAHGQRLRDLYRKAKAEGTDDAATWRDITHSTMVSALPTDLQATDPGIATACKDNSLPQNIVALYRVPTMDRKDRKAMNDIAGGVSTDDLKEKAQPAT